MFTGFRKEVVIDDFPPPFLESFKTNYQYGSKNLNFSNQAVSLSLNTSKVIVIGDTNVGKTSLVSRIALDMFKTKYKATIGVDYVSVMFKVFNIPFNLQIWDTAGQERFRSIAASYYRKADAVIVVYDVTLNSVQDDIENWLAEAIDSNSSSPYCFVVANKIDCLDDFNLSVAVKLGTAIAENLNAEYWAVSAKSGEGVFGLFRRIAGLCFTKGVNGSLLAAEARLTLGLTLPRSIDLHEDKKDICVSRISCK